MDKHAIKSLEDILNEYSEYLEELGSKYLPEDLRRELEIDKVLTGTQVS